MFSGATDSQVQQYFMELTGASQLPVAVPLTIRGNTGVRYTVATPSGNFTLRSVSSSESQTGPAWTIDIPKDAAGTSSAKKIKFLR
jgi:filamentous hemagglutinin